mmetsp:Transcript_68357/g.113175  ORF Transcript_68357/g.113175 Transcript_68357/m.113175 type:complete len:94 (-) Transcript_68357:162-443(-)
MPWLRHERLPGPGNRHLHPVPAWGPLPVRIQVLTAHSPPAATSAKNPTLQTQSGAGSLRSARGHQHLKMSEGRYLGIVMMLLLMVSVKNEAPQ